ncbi:hypothetical protein [Subtercola frigoramans]|uniref:Uncharacterized protein n=1 Tax=Subtercola frigoramans TaxID=120298 RepID=A0ABS2L0F7_9MICO|nr:hypothetical protein [Subtercola frigoramans]MBM7470553.1 hypothetical protein [Subtercola frigoramans]
MRKLVTIGLIGTLTLALTGSFILGTGGQRSACGATAADTTAAAQHPPVDGYSGDQLANAAAIMNAGAALGLDTTGQAIGVMTAIGESGLRDITYGDGAINPDGSIADSVGLFQQQHWWGSLADRMDPTKSATLFFQRLIAVPGWQSLPPSQAANKVQINADPNYYIQFYAAAKAIVTGLIGPDAACAAGISANAQALAQNLVAAIDAGKLVGAVPDHLKEIRWIAEGQTVPNCGIDVGILQVITIAYNTFGRIGISDINRACTGQIEGAGTASAHYINGGGHAVDFYSLGGTATNGADVNAIKLLKALDPVMPKGSYTGQSECRAAAGDTLTLDNLGQFDDTCTHVHVQVDLAAPTSLNL